MPSPDDQQPARRTARRRRPLLLKPPIVVAAVWDGDRWARWKAHLDYAGTGLADRPRLSGRVLVAHHPDPASALDALTDAADTFGITLRTGGAAPRPPALAFRAYSTDGSPVDYPGWRDLLRALADARRWTAVTSKPRPPAG
jgi:hypothetical protein